ncbi:MAG: BNR-repeat neuraminidase N-terminal domain-containing protein [Bacteroidia bacterium]
MARISFRQRPSNRLRVSIRQALQISVALGSGLIIALIVFINFSKHEDVTAQNTMVFESADIIRDTSTVLRGSINQLVLGIELKTTGLGNPVKLSNITFSTNGTSLPVSAQIENARLWFTGKENNFSTARQIGQTIPNPSEKEFEMTVNSELSQGKNYFWLTFDIKPEATVKKSSVTASCIQFRIGASTLRPAMLQAKVKKKIASNISFFSTGLAATNLSGSWNSKRDGSGIPPARIGDLNNTFFIQSGHKLVNAEETFLPTLVIEKNATLKAIQVLKAKNIFISEGGIYQQDFSILEINPVDNFRIENGGNYIHSNEGKLPGNKKYFSPASNQCFYKYSMLAFSEETSWGNVLINSTITSDMDASNAFRNIKGNLEIRRTGTNHYLFSGSTDTINIGGSLIFSGGSFTGPNGENNSLIINVAHDLIIKEGTFKDGDGSQSNFTVLNITGNALLIGGTFNFNQSRDGLSQINFCDSKSKTVYWSQKAGNIELGNINILPGKELVIKTGKIGNIAENRTLIVNGGAKLMCDEFTITGKGKFMLMENATLGIGHILGINSQKQEGNILTREKYFDSRATYCYYTGCTPQQTGVFSTSPENGTIKNLYVRKNKPSDYVVVSQSIQVSNQALVTLGQIDQAKSKLILSKISDTVMMGHSN